MKILEQILHWGVRFGVRIVWNSLYIQLERNSTLGLYLSVFCFLGRHLQCSVLSQSKGPCFVPTQNHVQI
jgi:hypothetical protein